MPEAGRVVAGTARGTRLLAPGEGTRPLADRVKQTLFGVLEGGSLGPWPVPFLDLYAGSGAAGIEALSRGAPGALFVERDATAAHVIADNLRRAGLAGSGLVVRGDALAVLSKGRSGRVGGFGAALLDPPYGDPAIIPALERLADTSLDWMALGAVVVAKRFWREELPDRVEGLVKRRERRFGETMLTFYVLEGPTGREEASG
ncbi:MAG TPA: RsmD family RNA methyltransferase [Candidatus Limnocylindrales bacterium]|jgi:16S rRNA (guanine966-N2)-methyltransferase|nr:RsmD family RNA methyltransferase [Candidatus Limnocylindrales bacterium]